MDNVIPIPVRVQYDDATKQFIAWLENAKKGEKYCYFSGVHIGGAQVARIAMKAYEKNIVTLFQSRGEKGFDYWAKKIR